MKFEELRRWFQWRTQENQEQYDVLVLEEIQASVQNFCDHKSSVTPISSLSGLVTKSFVKLKKCINYCLLAPISTSTHWNRISLF